MKNVAVHDEMFHADDVFSVAILKLIYPGLEIVRTRNLEKLKIVEARIDIGGRYDHGTLDYDHHQRDFKEKRSNGIPYASAGLIWKHYGDRLVSSITVWEFIEEKIIQHIDADDNGIRTYEAQEVEPYTLREIILSFNPEWPDNNNKNYNERFYIAAKFAMEILRGEIEHAECIEKAREIIKKEIAKTDKEYLVLEDNLPFQSIVMEESEKIKFVVKKSSIKNKWAVIGVRKQKNSFENRKLLPREWGGLANEKLAEITGVEDAFFCHKDLIVIVAKSKEGAIKLVELALENGS